MEKYYFYESFWDMPIPLIIKYLIYEFLNLSYQSQFVFLFLLFFVVLGIPTLINELTSSKS